MRIGVLGGTFDPPHLGHYLTAVDALEHLSLDQIIFIPNAIQPLKGGAFATPEQRLEMLRLMLGNDVRFRVESLEIERNGLSYTVETLEALKSRSPDSRFFLLAGADVLATFGQWREPARILELSTLAVLSRNREEAEDAGSAGAKPVPAGAVMVPTRVIDISSTEIRERVRLKKSIRGFVSESVAELIHASGLYNQVNG